MSTQNKTPVQLFLTISGNLRRKVPVVADVLLSHEQENYPINSVCGNCIRVAFRKFCIYYVGLILSFLAVKLKLAKGLVYKTYETKQTKSDHKAKSKQGAAEDQTEYWRKTL